MQRRIIVGGLWGALIISLTAGAAGWARPQLFRRASATQAAPQAPPEQVAPVSWEHDLKAAYRASTANGKPMLVVFGAPWCAYCRKLEAETLNHPTLVGFINASFIPVHLDFDKDRRAAQVLNVRSLPMAIILSPEADLLGSVEGYVKPDQFGQALRKSLEFQRTLNGERALAEERAR